MPGQKIQMFGKMSYNPWADIKIILVLSSHAEQYLIHTGLNTNFLHDSLEKFSCFNFFFLKKGKAIYDLRSNSLNFNSLFSTKNELISNHWSLWLVFCSSCFKIIS